MTPALAKKAIEIARAALVEVGLAPENVRISPRRPGRRPTIQFAVLERPYGENTFLAYRAAAIGAASVEPGFLAVCWTCELDSEAELCHRLRSVDVVAGATMCARWPSTR